MTYIYSETEKKMVPLERKEVAAYRGDVLDPKTPDVAVPKALREIECGGKSARQIVKEMGFKPTSLDAVRRAWGLISCVAFLMVSLASQAQSYMTPGYVFSDGSRLTAAQLGTLVANATIGYGFYTYQTTEPLLNSGDWLLVVNSGNQYRKISAANAILQNTNLFGSAGQVTNLSSNAFFLVWDGAASGAVYKIGATNLPILTLTTPQATNFPGGYVITLYDQTNWSQTTLSNGALGPYPLTNFIYTDAKNLCIQKSPSSADQEIITADQVLLANVTNGISFMAKNVNLTVDITSSGLLGLDTNTQASNTWYYTWAVSDGTNISAVLSTNASNPSVPPLQAWVGRLGAVWRGPGLSFYDFYQHGNRVDIAPTNLTAAAWVTNFGNTTFYGQFTNVSGTTSSNALSVLSNCVPPIARSVKGMMGNVGGAGGFFYALAGDTNGIGETIFYLYGQIAVPIQGMGEAVPFDIPMAFPQQIFVRGTTNTASGGPNAHVNVSGYGL